MSVARLAGFFFILLWSLPCLAANHDSSVVVIRSFRIIGNKKTKEHIILREMGFGLNDAIQIESLAEMLTQAQKNLMNTSLFNFVSVNYVHEEVNQIDVVVNVIERWYLWPSLIFEVADRNFNVWWRARDWTRVNYGFTLTKYNMRGRRETLQLTARLGTWQQYRLAYNLPFIGKNLKTGLYVSYSYLRNREVGYRSFNNELLFYNNATDYVRQEQVGRVKLTFRKKVFNTHSLEGRFTSSWVDDTLKVIGPGYFSGNKSSTGFFSLHYTFVSDHRDIKAYPLKGYLLGADISQFGLGVLSEESSGFLRAELELRYYHTISKKWFAGFWAKTRLASSYLQPYYLQRGLGYGNDYVRGFEYYVVDGQQTFLTKLFIKYQLMAPKTLEMGFGGDRFGKTHHAFYLNFFVDGGYVSDQLYTKDNPLANRALGGIGLGLDYVTYYDRVFRVEAALNSKNEPGVFFHYGIPF